MTKKSWVSQLAASKTRRCTTCGSPFEKSITEFIAEKKKGLRVSWTDFWRGLVREEGYNLGLSALMHHVRNCIEEQV